MSNRAGLPTGLTSNTMGSDVRISDLQEIVKDNCRAAKNITKDISSSKVEGSQNNASPINRTADIKTIADLFKAVKKRDENFNPKPTSAVLNEDGTPKVVYYASERGTHSANDLRRGFISEIQKR